MMASQAKTRRPAGGSPINRDLPAWSRYLDLTKPRLSLLSVLTVLIGYLAARAALDLWIVFHLAVGTSLAAGGAAALNQWWERRTDAAMRRTRDRPLPAGDIHPARAAALGLLLALTGALQLLLWVNLLAALLLVLTVATYVLVYTPLKKTTHWCTEVGAISGALPPLIGWAGAEGALGPGAWVLFGVLAFWQMPHFHAIAWLYRQDYAAAGFPMLAVIDSGGAQLARHMNTYGVLLFVCALGPWALGMTGFLYPVTAVLLNGYFLREILRFHRGTDRDAAARKIFFASILLLPLLLGTLVVDVWFVR